MEILIGILVIGVVIALCRLWLSASTESTVQANPTPGVVISTPYGSSANSWLFNQSIQDTDDSDSAVDTTDSNSSDSSTSPQDCSADFNSDSSGADCACPADTTSYDLGGCAVDSGNFDNGSSN